MVFRKFKLLFFAILLTKSFAVHAQNYYSSFGVAGNGDGQFNSAMNVSIDGTGNIYVTDQMNHRIQKFDKEGLFLMAFGSYGSANGQLITPRATAIDASGNIYVVNNGNRRIEKYSSSGVYLSRFGSAGSGTGQFNGPSGIAFDALGNIYVTDSYNHRVQKFSSAGIYLSQWGTLGSGNGQFNNPLGIAIDIAGNIYIGDSGNNRIQKFNSNLQFINSFGSSGNGNGQFSTPWFINIDILGNIYVADAGNARIQKFNNLGVFVSKFGSIGTGVGQMNYCTGVAVDATCKIYVADGNNRVQILIPDTTPSILSFSPSSASAGSNVIITGNKFSDVNAVYFNNIPATSFIINSPTQITAVVPHGNVTGNIRIETVCSPNSISENIFTVNSNLVCAECSNMIYEYKSQWRMSPAIADGPICQTVLDIEKDNQGYIYLYEWAFGKIAKYTKTGTLITKWGGVGKGLEPGSLAIDPFNNIFSIDSNKHVVKFSNNGVLISSWGIIGTGVGQFNYPSSLATDLAGNVYVLDKGNLRIQKYSNNGLYITQWNINPNFSAASNPTITIDKDGNVFICTDSDIFKFFSNDGVTYSLISQFGGYGSVHSGRSTDGLFVRITGISTDDFGNLYVTDWANNQVQKLTNSGKFISKFGGNFGLGNGQFNSVSATIIDDCDIYVADEDNDRIQIFSQSSSSGPKYTFLKAWGSKGTGNGQFNIINDMAYGASKIYVADYGNNRIQAFNYNGVYSNIQWGGYGTSNGQFSYPDYIACDKINKYVYVSDGTNRIQKFNSNGSYIMKWNPGGSTSGLAVDNLGNVYVSDDHGIDGNCIRKFTSTGTFILKFGTTGSGDGQFMRPSRLAIDSDNNIYVCDIMNNRIQKFSSDGAYITQWGGYGSGNGQFSYPEGITIDQYGNVYVADGRDRQEKKIYRIQQFCTNDGINYKYAYQFGSTGSGRGQFYDPVGIFFNADNNNIYVIDRSNTRLEIFSKNSLRIGNSNIDDDINEEYFSSQNSNILVYPNPNEGDFTVSVLGKTEYDVVLYNSIGEIILQDHSFNQNYNFSNHSLSKGIYIIKVIDNADVLQIKIIIK